NIANNAGPPCCNAQLSRSRKSAHQLDSKPLEPHQAVALLGSRIGPAIARRTAAKDNAIILREPKITEDPPRIEDTFPAYPPDRSECRLAHRLCHNRLQVHGQEPPA